MAFPNLFETGKFLLQYIIKENSWGIKNLILSFLYGYTVKWVWSKLKHSWEIQNYTACPKMWIEIQLPDVVLKQIKWSFYDLIILLFKKQSHLIYFHNFCALFHNSRRLLQPALLNKNRIIEKIKSKLSNIAAISSVFNIIS